MEEYWGLGAVPVITGLVQVIKPFVPDSRLYPVLALVMALAWNVGVAYVLDKPLLPAVPLGIVVGLAASGFYSVVAAVKNG